MPHFQHILKGIVSQSSEVDADLAVYLASLSTPLSAGQIVKLNTFVTTLKSGLGINNLADAFDLIQIYANETAEAGLKNLVKRTNDGSAISSPVFVPFEGYLLSGSDYINTNYNQRTDYVNSNFNNASIGIYVRKETTLSTAASAYFGANDGSNRTIYTPRRSSGNRYTMLCNGSFVNTLNYDENSKGMHIINRVDSTNAYLWVNKVNKYHNTIPSINTVNATLTVGWMTAASFADIDASLIFQAKSFSETHIGVITDAFEVYMDSNGKGIL